MNLNSWLIVIFGILCLIAIVWKRRIDIKGIATLFIKYRESFKAMAIIKESVISFDENGRMFYFNPRVQEYFGWNEFELADQNISMIIPKMYEDQFNEFKDSEYKNRTLEIECIRRDKEKFPAELTVGKSIEGEISYVISVRDIFHRKANEETNRKIAEELDRVKRLCVMGESIRHCASWSWNLVDNTVEYSDEFRNIFQLRKREVVTADDLMLMVFEEDRPKLNAAFLRAIEKGESYDIDYKIGHTNGTMDLINVIGVPELNKNGRPIKIHGSTLLLKTNVA